MSDLVAKKLQDVTRDLCGIVVERLERCIAIGCGGRYDRDDLLGSALEVWHPDAISRMDDLDRPAAWRQGGAVVDVMHPRQLDRLPAVHLEDHAIGQVQP